MTISIAASCITANADMNTEFDDLTKPKGPLRHIVNLHTKTNPGITWRPSPRSAKRFPWGLKLPRQLRRLPVAEGDK
ncbi:hypothetical protein BH10ACI3_BH10ACI3_17560 [soil metagenome]